MLKSFSLKNSIDSLSPVAANRLKTSLHPSLKSTLMSKMGDAASFKCDHMVD